MTTNRPKIFMAALVSLSLTASCVYDNEPAVPADGEQYAVRIALSTRSDNNSFSTEYGTSAENHIEPSALTVVAYDSDGSNPRVLFSSRNNSGMQVSSSNGESWIYARFDLADIPADKKMKLMFLQMPETFDYSSTALSSIPISNLSGISSSLSFSTPVSSPSWAPAADAGNCFPAFGCIDLDFSSVTPSSSDLSPVFNDMGTVWLVRAMAKVVVSAGKDVNIQSVSLKKTADKALICSPLAGYVNGKQPEYQNIPAALSMLDVNIPLRLTEEGYTVYLPEIPASELDSDRQLFEVTCDGQSFPLQFTSYTDGKPDATPGKGFDKVVRNNFYRFEILGIDSQGLNINVKVRPWQKHSFNWEI